MNDRQSQILEYIRLFHDAHGYSPSIRDIASATRISATSVVVYHLKRLEEMGYIARDRGIARGIRIIQKE